MMQDRRIVEIITPGTEDGVWRCVEVENPMEDVSPKQKAFFDEADKFMRLLRN
jgi:hypothetical protein